MNQQYVLPMIVTAVVVALIVSVATVALSEVLLSEPAVTGAGTSTSDAGLAALEQMKAEQETLVDRLTDLETLFDAIDQRLSGLAYAPNNGTGTGSSTQAPSPAVEDTPLADDDFAGRIARLERTLSALETRMQSLQREVVQAQEEEPERVEEYNRQQMESVMQNAQRAFREYGNVIRDRMMARVTEDLDLDEWQTEGFQEETARMFERMGEIGQRLRSGEITQDQAREEMAQVREDTDAEMQRLLTQDQYDRLQEMTNGQQNPLGRFLPGGGNSEGMPGMPGSE